MAIGIMGCGYGEDPQVPAELKVQYTQSDIFTIESLESIRNTYDDFTKGRLKSSDFHEAMDRALALILKGANSVEGKKKNHYTQAELQALFDSGILNESEKIKVWIKRIVALTNILLGEERDHILISDIEEIFRRIHLTAPHLIELSEKKYEMDRLEALYPHERDRYWKIRKQIFSAFIKVSMVLMQNNKGRIQTPLVKEVILKQYHYLGDELDTKVWEQYVEAGFIINKIIFGKSETRIMSEDVGELLEMIDFVYGKIFDVYILSEKKIWGAKEFLEISQCYIEILNTFLNAFYLGSNKVLSSKNLIKLFEALHLGSQDQAQGFIEAILELKSLMFKTSKVHFAKEEIKYVRDFLKDVLEDSKAESKKEESRLKHLWKSPFRETLTQSKEEIQWSSLLLQFIDQLIKRHDADQDKVLALHSDKLDKEVPNAHSLQLCQEMTFLVLTLKKVVKGFQQMMGLPDDVLDSFENIHESQLAKGMVSIADVFFLNSNKDRALDRFEILELINFFIENDRFVLFLVQNLTLKPLVVKLGETQGYQKIALVQQLSTEPFIFWYFPQLERSFSDKEALKHYLMSLIQILGLQHKTFLKTRDIKMVFGLVRLIEHFFMTYDANKDQSLDYAEILKIWKNYQPFMEEIFASKFGEFQKFFQSKPSAQPVKQEEESGAWTWFNQKVNQAKEHLSPDIEDIKKRCFFYFVIYQESPSAMYFFKADEEIKKKTITRKEIIKLLEKLSWEMTSKLESISDSKK